MTINHPRKVVASSGWQWINKGARYFMLCKLNWLAIIFIIGLITVFLMKISPILQLALIFVLPFVTAGLALACADIEQGKALSVAYLVKGFQSPNKFNIFRYGILLLLMMLISQILSSILLNIIGVSNEQLKQAMELLQSNEEGQVAVILSSPVLIKFFLLSILLILPVLVVNLFAPIILVFSSLTPIEAIKLSFMAGLKNIPAFIVYGLIYLAMIVLVVVTLQFFIVILVTIFGENSSIAVILYMFAFIACILTIASLSYCSAYVAFQDLFTGEDI
ncbi:MAG: hypothetical protein L3J53_01285 [Proteobacteria bacterium]|nr:hypothetical protein [Pseudomonadota bacterium]